MYKAKNVPNLQNQLKSCVSKVADWFKPNKLSLEVDETKLMIFVVWSSKIGLKSVKFSFHFSN